MKRPMTAPALPVRNNRHGITSLLAMVAELELNGVTKPSPDTVEEVKS